MKKVLRHLYVLVPAVLISVMVGCAGTETVRNDGKKPEERKVVQSGNLVDVSYLCKLKTGEVVASTERLADNQPLSSIFEPTDKVGPVSVTAGAPFPMFGGGKELLIRDEIKHRLAGIVSGMEEGERRTVELSAADVDTRTEQNYVVHLMRVRSIPKDKRIPVDEYKERFGKAPEVGQPFSFDPAIAGRVEAVDDKEVIIRASAKSGDVIRTPFGPGHIRETEKEYEIVKDATVGSLIRSGRLVARITAVDDKTITLDYRNPFGRELLTCGVTVEKVATKEEAEAEKTTEAMNKQTTETKIK